MPITCRLRCACAAFALAASAAAQPAAPGAGWTPVTADVLDSTRGGFTLGSGLTLSLGIERIVSLNGEVVARTSIALGDIAHLTPEQAQQQRDALSAVNLIQNGHDNIYVGALQPGATVIQNSLDGQAIRAETVISASVNSLGLLKSLNFQGSLGDAIARSVAAP